MSLADSSEQLVKEWHVLKNGSLTPLEVSRSDKRPVYWKCQVCGCEFVKSVRDRYYQGAKCPGCLAKQQKQPLRMKRVEQSLAYLNPFLMREWHPTLNEALNAFELNPKSSRRVWWQCSALDCQHVWQSSVRQRVGQGIGCPACVKRRGSVGYHYPDLKQEWDLVKNKGLDLMQLDQQSNREGVWTCRTCGTDYLATIQDRIKQQVKCPYCEALNEVKLRSRIYLMRGSNASNRGCRMKYYQLKD